MFDKERTTIPVVNLIFDSRQYVDEYKRRMLFGVYRQRSKNQTLVEMHKEVFGKQAYCYQGEFRYWVWDYGTWRVYVSNQKGICIEVDPGFNSSQTMDILRDYWANFEV